MNTQVVPNSSAVQGPGAFLGDYALNNAGAAVTHTQTPSKNEPRSFWHATQYVLKRGLDCVGASFGLVFLSPILLMVVIAIRRDSTGPVLFRQNRMGRDGRMFKIYKFRTMVVDAEARQKELESLNESKGGGLFKVRHDPRITKIGGFLRKSSLDELPQLINVLLGEMSLVGPRPLPARDCDNLKVINAARYERRLDVLPGVTGPWQVSGRSRIGAERMLELDCEYIDKWSLWKDLSILFRTVIVLLVDKDSAY